jgi:hypothetical protein
LGPAKDKKYALKSLDGCIVLGCWELKRKFRLTVWHAKIRLIPAPESGLGGNIVGCHSFPLISCLQPYVVPDKHAHAVLAIAKLALAWRLPMATARNPAPPGTNPPPVDPAQPPKPTDPPKRPWVNDEIVVTAFAILGVGGAVALPLRYGFSGVPPIVVSFLLATGLAALAYRYLGGIDGASFTVGAFKLTGALAALVGIAWFINGKLVTQVETVQVWDVYGKVVLNKGTMDQLVDTDFTLFPANATPAPNGDFHLRFIFDPANPVYVTIKHNTNGPVTYGPITIPLVPDKLKAFDPGFKMTGKSINMDPVVLPESANQSGYNNAPNAKLQQPTDLPPYPGPSEPAKTVVPTGGHKP